MILRVRIDILVQGVKPGGPRSNSCGSGLWGLARYSGTRVLGYLMRYSGNCPLPRYFISRSSSIDRRVRFYDQSDSVAPER